MRCSSALTALSIAFTAVACKRDDVRDRALAELRGALKDAAGPVRLHAAEGLIAAGVEAEAVRKVYLPVSEADRPNERVFAWRVLAQAAGEDLIQRQKYVDRLVGAFMDRAAADRRGAAESLAKLGWHARTPEIERLAREGHGEWFGPEAEDARHSGRFQAYARWILANSGQDADEASLLALMDSEDPDVRGTAAYAFAYLKTVSPASLTRLNRALEEDSKALQGARKQVADRLKAVTDKKERAKIEASLQPISRVVGNLLQGLFAHTPAADQAFLRREMFEYLSRGGTYERDRAATALYHGGKPDDLPALARLLGHGRAEVPAERDVRVLAACAILRISPVLSRGPADGGPVGIFTFDAPLIAYGTALAAGILIAVLWLRGSRRRRPAGKPPVPRPGPEG